MIVKENFDLGPCNTFGMKVSCARFIEYDSVGELSSIDMEALPQPVLHMGAGSNLLFCADFPGTVLHSGIKFIRIAGEEGGKVLVEAGAGVTFDDFCAWAASEGLWGPENLSGIPGEVGAGAVQNVGAYGVEARDIVKSVKLYDLREKRITVFSNADCRYAYRDSVFKSSPAKGRYAVLSVVFTLTREYSPRLDYGNVRAALPPKESYHPSEIRDTIIGIRSSKLPDPAVMGSAGSFFKNPVVPVSVFASVEAVAKAERGPEYRVPHFDAGEGMVKIPAAWLIDSCSLKGESRGGAAVYEKQPLVIVNRSGDATPQDVISLENHIIDRVRSKFGIGLHPEVEHIKP